MARLFAVVFVLLFAITAQGEPLFTPSQEASSAVNLMNLYLHLSQLEAQTNRSWARSDAMEGKPYKSRPTPIHDDTEKKLKERYETLLPLATTTEQRNAVKGWRVEFDAALGEITTRGAMSPETERAIHRANATLKVAFD